jgi:hypothetical protein
MFPKTDDILERSTAKFEQKNERFLVKKSMDFTKQYNKMYLNRISATRDNLWWVKFVLDL